jgi:hypothetical protein
MLVLQDCTDSQEDVLGSCIETYPAASRTINIKVEEFSDAEEEKDPLAIPFPEMKAEHVVSASCLRLLIAVHLQLPVLFTDQDSRGPTADP